MTIPDAPMRLIRSELSVPASDERKIARGLASAADAVLLDLEDSVALGKKVAARAAAAEAVVRGDWGGKPRVVRINDLRTSWCYRDVIEVIALAGGALDRVVVPKVRSTGDIAFVDRLLTQVEIEHGLETPITIEAQIEDPGGLLAVAEIARCSSRLELLTFGQGDFAAAVGMPANDIGVRDEWDDAADGDRWQLPRQMIVLAAAAAGIQALNGPYAAFRDAEGFSAYCRMSRSLGFAGVWCIHPDQIKIANDVFSPSRAEIERAELVVGAGSQQGAAGQGAFAGEGVMRDEATVRMARRTLSVAEALGLRQSKTDG